MGMTRAERQFRVLSILWLVLFGGGTTVLGVAIGLPYGQNLYPAAPLMALVWVGQFLLFLCSFYPFATPLRLLRLETPQHSSRHAC